MLTSISEPSLGTVGTAGMMSHASRTNFTGKKNLADRQRGKFLWQGQYKSITLAVVQAPWSLLWQTIILISVQYVFVIQLILVCYFESKYSIFWDLSILICELVYLADICINLLHAFWPLVRQNIRAYRRNFFLLGYDCLTILPLHLVFNTSNGFYYAAAIAKWINVSRIYRMFTYFWCLNSMMHRSRKLLIFVEHVMTTLLILHAGSCAWFWTHRKPTPAQPWHEIGYPPHVGSDHLTFDTYGTCWYYCACRLFNVIFGDAFPVTSLDKWITSSLMLIGCIFMRYRYIGLLVWDQIIEDTRRLTFVDRYHHMISYLEFHRAPEWLVAQARRYKQQLWHMKDGILNAEHLRKLPLPLQMELIFDINVGLFHSTIVLRDTSEAFMRQISLLMRHEIFLEGQQIWCQGIVKSGLMCIKRGTIEMLSDEDDDSPVIAFKEGTVLGELSLFYSIPAKVTVKAATYVEVQMLRRTDFMKAMSEHPMTFSKIRNILDTRLNKCKTRQKAIVEYDKGDSRLIRTRYRPMKILKDHLAGVVDEDSSFDDDSHLYYRDEKNVRKLKFTTEYLELYVLAKNVTTVAFPLICIRSSFPWILEPDTSFTRMIDVTHFLLVLYSCVMCPYVAILAYGVTQIEEILTTVVKAGLLLHIYLQLTTAFTQKSVIKKTVKEIAEVKMATFGFYLDIISVFPMYIFSDTLDPQGESAGGQIALLCPILQFWHIWDYMKHWEQNFYSNAKFLCLMRYGLILCLLSYWGGCFMYLIACPRKLCREHTWMAQLIYWETKVLVIADAKHEQPTLTALAFGTSTVFGAGSGVYAPGSNDLFLVSFLFIMGSYVIAFYTAKLSSIYMLSHQRKQKFKESMRELFYFLSVNRVSHKIKARVKKFFTVQWYYNNAVSTQELFSHMSSNIQQEILSIEMVDTLLNCPLFQDCSRDFLQTLAANSRTIVLPDNEVIQHAADISRDMYILQKGHCNLMSHRGYVAYSLGPGSQFGVVEMLYGLPKVYTALTTTNCILLHVEYSALVQCLSTFPDVYHPIATVLDHDEVKSLATQFEDAKPLTGKFDTKINRIAQEIKESFVVMTDPHYRKQYANEFEKLGIMRYIKYIVIPGSITPYGLFLKCWCALRFLVAVIYIVVIPYNIATEQYRFHNTYNWFDIFLYTDLVVMAYVAYYEERSLLVTHPLLTISHYLTHGFLLDVLTVFPFDLMISFVNDKANQDLYRMNKLLQVFRITGAFHYWEGDIMRVNQAVVFLKFLPVALTVVNMATAFSFLATCTAAPAKHSYFLYANCSAAILTNGAKHTYSKAIYEYINTFYWVFEMFLGSGCTPEIVGNLTDTLMVLTLQIFGVLYFAFMFGYVASTRSSAAHALLDHREKTNDLRNFLYQENTDPMLTAKTLKYFEYVWKRTNGSNPQQICRCLNSALMEDTLVFMYERTLREVPLFGNVERSFIRVITQHLTEMYFLKGDTVIQCRDIQPYIYIIYRGKVDVLSSYNEMITCMGPGGMFGNFTGQPKACSDVSIYASRSLDLLVIPSETFLNLVKYYPKIQEPLSRAFESTKDYILPINMDLPSDSASSDDSDVEKTSADSAFDSRSASSRLETAGGLSVRSSQSIISSAKSGASILTYQSISAYNMFQPGTGIYQCFGYITCVMAVLNYVFVLYNLVTINNCPTMFWFHTFFDMYFYMKTYFTIHEGYNSRHGVLIIDAVRCRRRYFEHKCRFYSDLFVNLPIEIFGFCFPHSMTNMHYLRMNRLFRVKYLWEFYIKTSADLTNNLTNLQTAMTCFVTILLLHTFTCVWLVILIALTPISIIRTLKTHLLVDQPPQQIWDYTTSFYVMTSELTATGSDEFLIDDMYSLTLLIFCIVSGKLLAAIVLVTSMQLVHSCNHALTIYEKATTELIDLLKNQGLSSYQLNKFWVYVQQLWSTERGRQLPALLAQTPYVRRCDLMSAMFGHHLRGCYLFADTGEPFLRQLTVVLDYTIFFPGNYIVVAGDSEARMHWVDRGTVSVVSVRSDLTETTHEYLAAGDIFGIMQGLNRGVAHCFSYRAETKVTILTLSLDSWINILPFFPDAQKIIAERSDVLFAQI